MRLELGEDRPGSFVADVVRQEAAGLRTRAREESQARCAGWSVGENGRTLVAQCSRRSGKPNSIRSCGVSLTVRYEISFSACSAVIGAAGKAVGVRLALGTSEYSATTSEVRSSSGSASTGASVPPLRDDERGRRTVAAEKEGVNAARALGWTRGEEDARDDDERHEVGRVLVAVPLEEAFSNVDTARPRLLPQRLLAARAELVVDGSPCSRARRLAELEEPPRVELKVAAKLAVDGVDLALGAGGVEERRREELGVASEAAGEAVWRAVKVVDGLWERNSQSREHLDQGEAGAPRQGKCRRCSSPSCATGRSCTRSRRDASRCRGRALQDGSTSACVVLVQRERQERTHCARRSAPGREGRPGRSDGRLARREPPPLQDKALVSFLFLSLT